MISLIGFMGAGKSTVGRALSQRLALPYRELDEEIVEASEYLSIPEIFAREGEQGFRVRETRALREALHSEDEGVLSTGGGICGRAENCALLRDFSREVLFLAAPFSCLQARVGDDANRPLFQDHEKARHLFNSRQEQYRMMATCTFETEGISVEDLVDNIMVYLKEQET